MIFSKIYSFVVNFFSRFSFYHSKNFNLDASSDALLLEGDPDLNYLREINQTYGSKDFLVLTYSPISSFTEKETILNIQLLKSKIEKLNWVDSVVYDNRCSFIKKYRRRINGTIEKL